MVRLPVVRRVPKQTRPAKGCNAVALSRRRPSSITALNLLILFPAEEMLVENDREFRNSIELIQFLPSEFSAIKSVVMRLIQLPPA